MVADPLWTGYRYREVDADGWATFWRLDPRGQTFRLHDWHAYPNKPGHRLWSRAATPAGVRAAWSTTATAVTLEIRAALDIYARIAPVDFLIGGELHQRHEVNPGEQLITVDLPGEPVDLEIWLPQSGAIGVRAVRFDGEAVPRPPTGPRWITYGSSITQCSGANGPSETWPALVARRHQWDLVALGFSGECHLDPIAARTIRDTPARLISMCLGINIYGAETFSGRTLPGQVESFVSTVRDGHPHTPLVVITPLIAPDLEGKPNAVGLTLDDVRACIELGARTLHDPDLHLIDGRTILTPEEARHLYADEVHPTPDGYHLIADRLAPLLTLPL
ncbi:GDSL-like lipase/acylhydrolase family protein [Kribbella sp. VKM Ac-2527]|uniref:GDSL-like lipase/acylhydrolase family protein n=1 Tax=Kribbella caucasensis TaxID=2512215 RepID=A0A4R6K937_9ACTN|nr:GDSL-type esterase/lipase family protein [Kribbella sp. VKM Ac-2527]TDO45687.1 GDSL-like lipase/acylhydrolase family protein [Kribbella sp. VKM Ac-2527]